MTSEDTNGLSFMQSISSDGKVYNVTDFASLESLEEALVDQVACEQPGSPTDSPTRSTQPSSSPSLIQDPIETLVPTPPIISFAPSEGPSFAPSVSLQPSRKAERFSEQPSVVASSRPSSCTEIAQQFECVPLVKDPANGFSLITKGSAATAAKSVYKKMFVGGTLSNPSSSTVTVNGRVHYGEMLEPINMNFNGGKTQLGPLDTHPVDFEYYKWLATHIMPGQYDNGREVIVVEEPKGSCYNMYDFLGSAPTVIQGGINGAANDLLHLSNAAYDYPDMNKAANDYPDLNYVANDLLDQHKFAVELLDPNNAAYDYPDMTNAANDFPDLNYAANDLIDQQKFANDLLDMNDYPDLNYAANDNLTQGENNGRTLIVFTFSEDICFTKTNDGRQFGPSILAPFSKVTLTNSGYADGIIIAREFTTVNGGSTGSEQQLHGDIYDG